MIAWQDWVGLVPHIATLFWVIDFGVESRESLTVTHKSAYWVMPVPYSPVKDNEFVGRRERIVFQCLQLYHQTQNCHNFLTVWLFWF